MLAGTSHQGQPECGSGSGLPQRSRGEHGMEHVSRPIPVDSEALPMGPSHDRFVCKSPKSSITPVFLPMPRLERYGGRCASDTVAGSANNICLSSDHFVGSRATENFSGTPVEIDSGGTPAPGSSVVPTTSTAPMYTTNADPVASGRFSPTSLVTLASEPVIIQSVPLVHQFPALTQAGFSEAVIARLNSVLADSTNKIYMSQWKLFVAWCHERRVNPLNATAVSICDFFLYLFKVRKVTVKTIEGYKSAISFILKRSSGYEVAENTTISDVIRSLKRERPRIHAWKCAGIWLLFYHFYRRINSLKNASLPSG